MSEAITSKSWYRSRTIWGVIVALLAQVISRWGYDLTPALQGEVVNVILDAVSAGGAGLAIFGRVKASKAIAPVAVRSGVAKALVTAMLLGGLALGGPTACAGYTIAQAEDPTPAQVIYAAQSEYNKALHAAAVYVESDIADEEVVAVLHRLSTAATETILDAQKAVRSGGGESPAAAAAVTAAHHAVEAFVDYLTSKGIL